MNSVSGIHLGDRDIDEDTHIGGVTTGNVTVLNGQVVIGGTVQGRVTVRGGAVTIRGVVAKGLYGDPTAIRIAEGAVVSGKTLNAEGEWVRHTEATTVLDSTPTHALSDVGAP